MAIAHSTLTSSEGTPTLGVIDTASVTLAADALHRVAISMRAATDPSGGTFSVTGGSRTWVEIGRGGNVNRLEISFRSMGSGASGALTLNLPVDANGAVWAVIETTGVITGNNGADAITDISVNGNRSDVIQPNLTITGTPGTGDETFADLMVEDSQTWTEGAGWTADSELVGSIETGQGCYHSTGQDQTFTVTDYATNNRNWGVVGGILKIAAAAPGGARARLVGGKLVGNGLLTGGIGV